MLERLRTGLVRYASLGVVLAGAALWAAVTVAAPGWMRWMGIASGQREEGPFELFEEGLLAVTLLAWALVAWRTSRNRLAFGLGVAMMLQIGLVLGEETDWGQQAMRVLGERNLRMYFRAVGVLPPEIDAIVPNLFWFVFLLAPLVPDRRVQELLARAAPVRAYLGDALAVLAVPALYLTLSTLLGAEQSFEFVQTSGYLIVAVVTARTLWATRG